MQGLLLPLSVVLMGVAVFLPLGKEGEALTCWDYRGKFDKSTAKNVTCNPNKIDEDGTSCSQGVACFKNAGLGTCNCAYEKDRCFTLEPDVCYCQTDLCNSAPRSWSFPAYLLLSLLFLLGPHLFL